MARKKNITVEDLWQMERLGAPSLSPDGAQAVAAVTRYSMADNKAMSSLWLLSTLGGEPRALTTCGDKDGQPRWSPPRGEQGELIAFTAKREQEGVKDKESQLYVMAPDGGEARRAAQVATGVDAFRWCAGGQRLVFVSWVWPQLAGQKAQAAQHKTFSERKETGYATSEAQYRHWDHNLPMDRVPHLHLLELSKTGGLGTVRDLFEGTPYELTRADPGSDSFDVSPDGKRIVFAFDPAPVKRGDGRYALAEMELRSRKVQVIAQHADWDMGAPRYSPDGQRIAFTASQVGKKHTMPAHLALWERNAKSWEAISRQWDHEVHAPLQWADDGLSVLFCAEDKGRTHLWRFNLAQRQAQVEVAGAWVTAFDQAGDTLVTLMDAAAHPSRLHVHRGSGPALRMESFNDTIMDTLALGAVQEVWVKGADPLTGQRGASGDPVQMWLVYPPGFDAKKSYPVMHNIHGGPHTGPGDNWHYRWNTQLFAAQGYIVASVNYHGSSGFGYAFLDSITHRWGALELQDIEAGTDWLLKKPFVDRQRIFAAGGSYGGFMVAWMNGHVKPGRYQAYICHAGCFDWTGMFADDAWYWHAKELGAWYWDDLAKINSQSPHAFAKNFRTPTLVIHGALDYRVPDAQGLAYYNTLKARDVDARLLWYPDENHWILKPRNSQLWYREFFNWLAQHDPKRKPRAKTTLKATPKTTPRATLKAATKSV